MERIQVIDADTHVDETEDTWEYLDPGDEQYRPETTFPSRYDAQRPIRYWSIDGHRKHRRVRDDSKSRTTLETRELIDVQARLRHMDELGTEVQVIYPSLFLVEPTVRPEVELALTRSYNRWLADRCSESHGRLRWVFIPSASNPESWSKELQAAKDQGACGVLKKGDQEAGKWPADPYFYPLYEEIQRLDMPLCFHLGAGTPDFTPARELPFRGFMGTKAPVINGISTLLSNGVTARFPTLRIGSIEAGASWVPFVVYDLRRRLERFEDGNIRTGEAQELGDDIFRSNRIYVTCQVDEDLPYLLGYIGEDNLLTGSDYTHQDQSQEMRFPERLQQRGDRGEIAQSTVRKILYDNPKTFYGL